MLLFTSHAYFCCREQVCDSDMGVSLCCADVLASTAQDRLHTSNTTSDPSATTLALRWMETSYVGTQVQTKEARAT